MTGEDASGQGPGLPGSHAARARLGRVDACFHIGDGSRGVPEEAPFDAVLVAAAAPSPPVSLVSQLREGGRMVIPVGGEREQDLVLLRREGGLVKRSRLCGCAFVKLVGAEGWDRAHATA